MISGVNVAEERGSRDAASKSFCADAAAMISLAVGGAKPVT